MDVVRNPEANAGMPAGAIEDQYDLLGGTGSHLARELGELDFEEGDAHRGGQVKDGPPGGGMDETHQVAPGEAVLHGGDGALANRRPDAAEERLEANAVFVGRPEFDLGSGKGGGDLPQQGP